MVDDKQQQEVDDLQEQEVDDLQEQAVDDLQEQAVDDLQEQAVDDLQEQAVDDLQEQAVDDLQEQAVDDESEDLSAVYSKAFNLLTLVTSHRDVVPANGWEHLGEMSQRKTVYFKDAKKLQDLEAQRKA